MRSLFTLFAIHALACLPAIAQTKQVLKTISTNGITESLVVPSGKTLTIASGATLTAASGSTITGIGSGLTIGSSTITSGTSGRALYNNSGVLGELDLASTYAPIASPTFTGTITTGTGGIVSPNPLFPTRNITISQGTFSWQNVVGSGFGVQLAPSTPTADRIVNFNPNGLIVSTADTGTVTNTMLAGSIALSKLATTGTASSSTYLRGDSTWATIDLSSYLPLAGGTATGLIQFSGTGHAGLRLNNLTTTQRDALTGSAGMAIWNTSTGRLNVHNGTSWSAGMVRLDGDTMTGPLNINLAADGVPVTWQVGGSNRLTLTTSSTAANLLWGHPSFVTFETSGGAFIVKYANSERNRITFAENTNNIALRGGGTTQRSGVYIQNNNLSAAYVGGDIRINTTVGVFVVEPLARDAVGGYTGQGHTMQVRGGDGHSATTGAAGGALQLYGGDAKGSGNNNGGSITLQGGAPTGTGTRGAIIIQSLPTSSAGLSTGTLWNDAGTLKIAP